MQQTSVFTWLLTASFQAGRLDQFYSGSRGAGQHYKTEGSGMDYICSELGRKVRVEISLGVCPEGVTSDAGSTRRALLFTANKRECAIYIYIYIYILYIWA